MQVDEGVGHPESKDGQRHTGRGYAPDRHARDRHCRHRIAVFAPRAPGHDAVGDGQRQQQVQAAGLGGEGEPYHTAQRQVVAPPAALDHVQHEPEGAQRQEYQEGLRPVEVAELDAHHGEGAQGRRQQADAPAVEPPPQDVEQQNGGSVGQGGKNAPGGGQVLEAHGVHEGLQPHPDDEQHVEQDAAQREPVGIEWALLGAEEGGRRGHPRLVHREISVDAAPPGRIVGNRLVHAVHPQEDGPLVGVVEPALVPVEAAVEPQTQGHGRDDEGQQR